MSEAVLVVDDEAHVVEVMRTFLQRAGFQVHAAANGEDGLRVAETHHLDAVISDFEMPRIDGREMIERLLARQGTVPRVLFLVTSRTDSDLRDWVERTEGVFFVEKPASPRRLVQNLTACLRGEPLEATS